MAPGLAAPRAPDPTDVKDSGLVLNPVVNRINSALILLGFLPDFIALALYSGTDSLPTQQKGNGDQELLSFSPCTGNLLPANSPITLVHTAKIVLK